LDNLTFYENIEVTLDVNTLVNRNLLRKSIVESDDFKWALEQAKESIHPCVATREAIVAVLDDSRVLIGDQEFTSRILRVNVAPCDKVYPFIATIGPELESLAAKQSKLTKKFYLEMVGDFSLMSVVKQIEERVMKLQNIKKGAVITPGELKNWPITQQVPLFNLFGNSLNRLGVELTTSMMMKPRKSRSGIVFESQNGFIQCQLCSMDRCPGRVAKYIPEKYLEYDLPIPKE
jgi:hypothetical protein